MHKAKRRDKLFKFKCNMEYLNRNYYLKWTAFGTVAILILTSPLSSMLRLCCRWQGSNQMSSNSEFYLKTCATTSQPIFYVLIAVSGTLEEGFELRKNMDYRPFGNDGPGRVNATFLGKALVRGYKSYLDIKDPTCESKMFCIFFIATNFLLFALKFC